MSPDDREQLFSFLKERDEINHERFMTGMEIQLAEVKGVMHDEISRLENKIDSSVERLDNKIDKVEAKVDSLTTEVKFIKKYLKDNLEPRVTEVEDKVESIYYKK